MTQALISQSSSAVCRNHVYRPESGAASPSCCAHRRGPRLGSDVKIYPCQTIVPFHHQHVFAQIKPSTRTRIDFGLALKDAKKKPPQRLLDTGGPGKGDRITHQTDKKFF
ncbi:MAG: hypothetical protein ONB46_24875 [candidate division KSB1 bacterium]|nr:hypothetical protein [candidate division KSB1 bacterium]MDZ7369140.1 hypothetical protein [candidate division KSB1 bacterium]MDZ7407097.1 hypothetical protein [candidate division KSB1 bacterium]